MKNIISFDANTLRVEYDSMLPKIIFEGYLPTIGGEGISICKYIKLHIKYERFNNYLLTFHKPQSMNESWYELTIFFEKVTVVIFSSNESILLSFIDKYIK